MTADGPLGDQHDDPARAIIRSFWKVKIKGLRDRCDAERLRRNLGPVQNREIAKATGIPESTLSDLMTCKRDVIPDWDDRVGLIVDCLGGKTQEWVPKWREAKTAYDSLGKNGTPRPQDTSTREKSSHRRVRIALSAGAVVVVLVVGVWLLIDTESGKSTPVFDAGTQPAAGNTGSRCIRVKDETETVSVFKDPAGHEKWTEWPGKTRFRAEVDTSNPHRYRVLLNNGQYGYVNTDRRYVTTAKDCP